MKLYQQSVDHGMDRHLHYRVFDFRDGLIFYRIFEGDPDNPAQGARLLRNVSSQIEDFAKLEVRSTSATSPPRVKWHIPEPPGYDDLKRKANFD
jgi:hypothetical protein